MASGSNRHDRGIENFQPGDNEVPSTSYWGTPFQRRGILQPLNQLSKEEDSDFEEPKSRLKRPNRLQSGPVKKRQKEEKGRHRVQVHTRPVINEGNIDSTLDAVVLASVTETIRREEAEDVCAVVDQLKSLLAAQRQPTAKLVTDISQEEEDIQQGEREPYSEWGENLSVPCGYPKLDCFDSLVDFEEKTSDTLPATQTCVGEDNEQPGSSEQLELLVWSDLEDMLLSSQRQAIHPDQLRTQSVVDCCVTEDLSLGGGVDIGNRFDKFECMVNSKLAEIQRDNKEQYESLNSKIAELEKQNNNLLNTVLAECKSDLLYRGILTSDICALHAASGELVRIQNNMVTGLSHISNILKSRSSS
ncbi:uncharacterized protein LOC119481684 [Sebastes umbrosus]|uniref:uncharacterized protein LOC119481682 n=1 Tax=Sebastes umbrosus TaxID=72105 RepID=UPI00189E96D6|nr:uncharacterized protein LOC119481662 isoform X2 [Sebastes umbrosus]XP_037614747.1 uncharacterized protein LOC119481682 [Sebastes umbrosus]XP_037614748.1 uncharacterized protein LOC119481683 [Sebastes umbrosus]XP_037614749.1 uncharacterized protein LOC119481684 [Sebastes umbrosus]